MAKIVQVSLQGVTNLSKDRFVNTLYFDGAFGEGQADELWQHYTYMKPAFGGLAGGGHTIKVYDSGDPEPRQPELDKTYDWGSPSPAAGPHEVALCLSYTTEDNPDFASARQRGRIFLGPLAASSVGQDRPTQAIIDQWLEFGEFIATVGTASETTWVLYSRRDNAFRKIESIYIDNAWDTQRRRGLAPTGRTVQDVQ